MGRSKVVRQGTDIVLVGAGVTLNEAVKAEELLKEQKVSCTVIDVFSVKPFDAETLVREVEQTKSRSVLCIEDHYPEGGIYGRVG